MGSAVRAAVVGPGRVGTAVASALRSRGHDVVGVAGRGATALDAFLAVAPEAVVRPVEDVGEGADVIVLCVPDDVLEVVSRAVAVADRVPAGSRWIHVAGSRGTAVLRPLLLAGGRVAACHPAVAFPDAPTGAARLPGASWAVTADAADVEWALAFVEHLGGRPAVVREDARVLYHAGLTLASNATAAVVALGRDLLLAAGVVDPTAFLEDLATSSAAGAASSGVAALTGPVRRGDAGTVARHLRELRAVLPEAVEVYTSLARLQIGLARRAGLDPGAAAAVARALDGEGGGSSDPGPPAVVA